jgi:hypothetical protein
MSCPVCKSDDHEAIGCPQVSSVHYSYIGSPGEEKQVVTSIHKFELSSGVSTSFTTGGDG